jgi:hypothetical protein
MHIHKRLNSYQFMYAHIHTTIPDGWFSSSLLVHIYIHICIYMYVCVYIHICIYIYTHVYTHTYINVHAYTYMYAHIHTTIPD